LPGWSIAGSGKASVRRVPVDKLVWMLGEYRTHHLGRNVKHFHEHIRQQHGFRWGVHLDEDVAAHGGVGGARGPAAGRTAANGHPNHARG
jgi:hypothetical protein